MGTDDIGCALAEWLDIVRRARLGRTVKAVAYYLGGRANNDGSHLFPGVARIAVECEISYASARSALAALRKAGLVERVRQGNRKAHKADEYRLTLNPALLVAVDVRSPDVLGKTIEQLNRHNREQAKARPSALSQKSADEVADTPSDTPSGASSALPQKSADGSISAKNDPPSALRTDRPTPIESTSPEKATLIASVVTDATKPAASRTRARSRAQDENPPSIDRATRSPAEIEALGYCPSCYVEHADDQIRRATPIDACTEHEPTTVEAPPKRPGKRAPRKASPKEATDG